MDVCIVLWPSDLAQAIMVTRSLSFKVFVCNSSVICAVTDY